MNLDSQSYLDKVRACWLGKGIGGTLGMPFEGCRGPFSLTFYDPVPTESPPNDDVELQLLWLLLVERHGAAIRAADFGEAWKNWYPFEPDEYGVARWNLRRGLQPPVTGLHNNAFTDGMGGAIRSEIWACLFPGRPDLAAAYAREDACVDHHGNGVWAEQFLAAAESAAFVESDIESALEQGFAAIPADCRVARAMRAAADLATDGVALPQARRCLLDDFGTPSFTDVSMNLPFIVYALVAGRGDFGATVTAAVNCGMDTDCTGATAGAFLGILRGTDGIPAVWREPVGEAVVCSEFLASLPLPKTVDELTQRLQSAATRARVQLQEEELPPWTPDVATDPVDDGNAWSILCRPGGETWLDSPADIAAAIPPQPVRFPGIHLDLDPYLESPGCALYLSTHVSVSRDVPEGLLLLSGTAGCTAWWDDRMVLNYHGPRDHVPAFHRTQGGGTVPVTLRAGTPNRLILRLAPCFAPMKWTVAVGQEKWRYADGVSYQAT